MNIGSKLLRPFKKDLNLNYLLKRIDRESRVKVNVNLQKNILNFYNKNTISPYVPMAAKGPWILTQKDEIIYVLPEDKCQGFDTGKKQTIAEWIENENVNESDELTSKWNSFLIKLKDSETIKKKHFPIIFKKVFYDFDDEFVKS